MKKKRQGFTLLEMMIVVVIIGILAAASLPLYGNYVRKSRIAEVNNALGDMRQSQVVYFDDPMLGDFHFASNIAALGWKLDNGTTIGKHPAYFTYSCDEIKVGASTPNLDIVLGGFSNVHITIRTGEYSHFD